MFRSTMCQCLRKLFNVGSLFMLLFAYNTFVPFSFTQEFTQGFTGESTSRISPAARRIYAVTTHTPSLPRLAMSTRRCKTARHLVLSWTAYPRVVGPIY